MPVRNKVEDTTPENVENVHVENNGSMSPSDMLDEALPGTDDSENIDIPDFDDTTTAGEDVKLSFDDIDGVVNTEEIERGEAQLTLTKGLHRWSKRPEVTYVFSDEPGKHWDINSKGRCIMTVSGRVKNKETNREHRFSFQYSPDRRNDDNGEEDFRTQNHRKLCAFFLSKNARRHTGEKELKEFLEAGKYWMYITVSKTGRAYFSNFQQ